MRPVAHTAAQHAVRAAKHHREWGFDATTRYAFNRGVEPLMLNVAVRFEARRKRVAA
jgi:hypothetical protein